MKKIFVSLMTALICQVVSPLSGQHLDSDFFNLFSSGTGKDRAHANQNAVKLIQVIPPELQNLPYATYPPQFPKNVTRSSE